MSKRQKKNVKKVKTKNKMNDKYFISFLLIVFLIGIVSPADQKLGSFDQDECVNLIQTCASCTYVNITQITYQPTSTEFLTEEATMQKEGTRYNYTFCNTSLYGIYVYDTYGDVDGTDQVASVSFRIGEDLDVTQGFVLIGQIAMIAFFLSLGLTFAKEKWKLKSFFYMMATGMGVILLNSTRIIASQSGRLNSMGNVGLIVGIVCLLFMVGLLLVYFTVDVLDSIKQKQERKWM